MAGPKQPKRWLIIAATVILAGTAVFHSTGYTTVSAAIQATDAKPFFWSPQ